ncbi:MAG: ATP-dependent DNA helicase RecG [Chloroflexi bacterium]|nr:ATP-dependent DNA helicase RecG [Chloroflexota bacterium]
MTNPFETLRKILQNEAARGYDNKGMVGGIDKFIPAFEQQARNAGLDEALIADVVAWMKNYQATPLDDRAKAMSDLLARLPVATTTPPTPRPAAQPPARPAPSRPAPTQQPSQQQRPPERSERRQEPTQPPQQAAASPAQAVVRPPEPSPKPRPPSPPPPPRRRASASGALARPALGPEPSGVGLDAPLTVLRGVGPERAEKLKKLGLSALRDALTYFPRRYVDYSQLKTINRLEYGEEVTIIATVWESYVKRTRSGQSQMVTAVLSDGTGAIELTWFNQPWLVDKLSQGKQVQVAGRVDQYLGRLTLRTPQLEDVDTDSLNSGRIVPIYNLTQDITGPLMRRWMFEAVGYTASRVPDPLPAGIRERAALINYTDALLQIHFPDSPELLNAARKRLAFDELLLLLFGIRRQRAEWQSAVSQSLTIADEQLNSTVATLPYALTGAQTRALADIRGDLAGTRPMNRLLQGDVGSGKTVVAALAMSVAVNSNAQAALMAPTAILAEQHYRNISKLLTFAETPSVSETLGVSAIALLLGSTPDSEKQTIYAGLRDGSIKIVIGTQALIQDKVEFANLGLVVVDEQHRFGVAQRAKLRGKGGNPHLLVMTATPIPRTLALTVYGDLDLSIIDEMPPGRQPIETRVVYVNERERAYAFLRSQIQQGRQAFIICPLVEESDKIEAKAAVDEHARLQSQVFPDLRLGLLHGRMKPDEKDEVMTAFRAGENHILVSTSVVEVGVDVPNASVMLVEGANRFGLAQLHQFRGRVGRGEHKSYCLLASDLGMDSKGEGDARLKAMEQTQDGFVLAEKDLDLRGPGEFLGTRQAGFGDLRLAKLTDLPLINLARREAETLFTADPNLEKPEHALLAEKLAAFWQGLDGAGDVS